jgi:glycosyltransferase involved in cell wall biosynthesis
MGRVLTEAALGGRPSVAYDIDWRAELIQTDKTGELVLYKDCSAMTNAVEKYLRDPDYAKSMGEKVRVFILALMNPGRLNKHERDL